MALMEEAQCGVINGDGKCMVTKIIKDGDVIVTSRREVGQRIQVENSWMRDIYMLIYFMFAYVTRNLTNLCADEGEPVNNLFAGQRKEKLEYSKKSEHILEEPKDQRWKAWLKGLFKMRTLPKFTFWVSAAILQKNNREETDGQEPMNNFKLGSLM